MKYLFKCQQCDAMVELDSKTAQPDANPKHLHEASGHVWVKMLRDYKTERAGTSLENLRKARE